mmetsp:Transcript_8165/g.22711  ORF Transcript_8165/g.22711 Transcript_8165/m.22711 type:complete len:220 (-) Transcript_8165:1103-1762(-)
MSSRAFLSGMSSRLRLRLRLLLLLRWRWELLLRLRLLLLRWRLALLRQSLRNLRGRLWVVSHDGDVRSAQYSLQRNVRRIGGSGTGKTHAATDQQTTSSDPSDELSRFVVPRVEKDSAVVRALPILPPMVRPQKTKFSNGNEISMIFFGSTSSCQQCLFFQRVRSCRLSEKGWRRQRRQRRRCCHCIPSLIKFVCQPGSVHQIGQSIFDLLDSGALPFR